MKRIMTFTAAAMFLLSTAVYAQDTNEKTQQEQTNKNTALTQEQREKIRLLRFEWEKEKTRFQAERKISNMDLQELMKNKDTAEQQVRRQMEKVSEFDINLRLGERKLQNSILSLLTEEQQKQFNQRANRGNVLRRQERNRQARPGVRSPMRRNSMQRGTMGQRFRGRSGRDLQMNRFRGAERGRRGGGNTGVMSRMRLNRVNELPLRGRQFARPGRIIRATEEM